MAQHGVWRHRAARAGVMLALLLTIAGAFAPMPTHAQGDGLLQNASFDGAYTGRAGIAGGVPQGWQVWGNFQDSDHESLSVLRVSAPYSWRLRTNSGLPTGGGYQTVSVQSGTRYRFSVYALIWTCNDEEWQCRDDTSTWSDPASGGRVRVGIDPTGGTNPYAGSVVWSGFSSPMTWGSFAGLSVEATASAGQITVFTYYGADQAMRFNDVFWDNASLVAVGSGSSGSSGGSQAPAATAVPVQNAPVLLPDGAYVHVVQPGQTLWAISRAYGVPLETLIALNNLSSTTIYVGQQIIVQAAPATAVPIATTAPVQPTATPIPTTIAQFSTPLPTQSPPETVRVGAGADSDDDGAITGTTRTVVLAVAVVVILGAVGATGALAGYIAYRIFRA